MIRQPRRRPMVGDDPKAQARADALRLLKFRPRSRQELSERLATRGYDPAVVQHVLDDLERRRMVDDTALAKLWATHRMEQRGFGALRVRQELRAKGVDDVVIRQAVGEVARDVDEAAQATEAAAKYLRRLGGLEPAAQKRRLWGFLMRRGFSGETVSHVVSAVCRP